ncbi:MAG: hypothetical protein JSU79_08855 [Dehalococcoidales bacterium]|nr:MAG: hypothetical protein JSU79_08855 [Dehalococcoidales bacterium]
MQRQYLDRKADRTEYNELFRLMSPVRTPYWCRPGSPPSLAHHADFNEYSHVFDMRSRREIIKGRFQGGSIAYIYADELPLFASVYSKDRRKPSYEEFEILELLLREGPMTIASMKEITGLLAKQITPILHKLQQKFLVFEDQADDEWDRAWYLFETEFPDVDLDKYEKEETLKILVCRFAYLNVFIDTKMLKSFYQLPEEEFQAVITKLVSVGTLNCVTIDDDEGFVMSEDIPLLEKETLPPRGVFVIDRNDFLFKSNENYLAEKFNNEKCGFRRTPVKPTMMQFILVDGEFRGYTAGYFRIRPNILEDIILDLAESEIRNRKEEILEAVRLVNDPEVTPVQKYCGKKV